MSIYLDYNATAPVKPEVAVAMTALMGVALNPSSVHAFGREAKKHLEEARRGIAEALNCFSREIVFTASATEANNWALGAFPERLKLLAATEHSSVLSAVSSPEIIPVHASGLVDMARFEALLAYEAKPALVSVMLANNETGVIQPIADIAALCHRHGALLHVDAVQGLGKIPLDITVLGADLITITGHKCGGPVGAAALVIRSNVAVSPFLKGGGQELRRRAGTENVAAITGFAKAVELAQDFAPMRALDGWLREMEAELGAYAPEIAIYGSDAPRLPNVSCLSMPGVSHEVQMMHFDLAGIAVSAGSACSSGRVEPSHVLRAMGASVAEAGSAIRISGGWNTQKDEIKLFTQAWKALYDRLKR